MNDEYNPGGYLSDRDLPEFIVNAEVTAGVVQDGRIIREGPASVTTYRGTMRRETFMRAMTAASREAGELAVRFGSARVTLIVRGPGIQGPNVETMVLVRQDPPAG